MAFTDEAVADGGFVPLTIDRRRAMSAGAE